ncbi:unnamed protein product [Dicrocoelium dendriticum]|nr:unnamed protein product [Dicrocoelium dendriticum]
MLSTHVTMPTAQAHATILPTLPVSHSHPFLPDSSTTINPTYTDEPVPVTSANSTTQYSTESCRPQSRLSSLLQPGTQFKLAAFNVRTLLQIGQQAGVARTLETLGIDICCLTETRLQDSNSVYQLVSPLHPRTRFHLRLSGDAESAASGQAGVGIALSARAETALIDWIPINSRLCAMRLHGSCKVSRCRVEKRALFVISAYAPTDCSSDIVKDQFYQNLHELLLRAPKTDIIVLAGDFNARVGRLLPCERHLGGPHGYDDVRSDNGERLLSLCADHQLFLSSTSFRHPGRQYATWRPPSSTQRWSQIDHIAISRRWRGSVRDCRSFWSTCVDTDHALVCATVCMRFGGSPRSKHTRLNAYKLEDPMVKRDYQQKLREKLPLSHTLDVDQHWSSLQQALLSAGLSSCGLTRSTPKCWISGRSSELLDRRRAVPAGAEYNEHRRSITQQLKASLRSDRESWWSKQAGEMEAAASAGNFRRLFYIIRATGCNFHAISQTICEADGTKITNLRRRLGRWSEHFALQFNHPTQSPATPPAPMYDAWPVSTAPPNEAEIRNVVQSLKRHKASGPDNLPPALFKDGGSVLISEILSLFTKVWTEEKVPSSWGESVIVPIHKKGSRDDCCNYRGISLISVASKIFVSVLLGRLSTTREEFSREEQAGFRPGRGCIDQIFTLRQVLELRHIHRRPTIVVFLDIRAAFDSVDRSALWNCLLKKGVPDKFVTILKVLYSHTSGKVRAYGTHSSSFAVTSGVRQGCPISPFLFNFAIEDVLQRALEGVQDCGVELLPGDRLTDLDYADDIALLGDDPQSVQNALDRLAMEASKYGLCFTPGKCKTLLQDWQVPEPALTIAGHVLEQVPCFTYLGSCITAGGGVGDEVSQRIAKARLAFIKLRHLWRRRDVTLKLKGRVYNASVRAVLLYGCETWPIRSEDMKRLSVFDNRCLRRIARVWWQHHVSNAEVRDRVLGTNSASLQDVILRHRMRWLGHVLRMPAHRLPRRALFALPGSDWKKCRGGQPMTWRRSMKKATSSLAAVGPVRLPGWGPRDAELQWLETLDVMARNRHQWRQCCSAISPSL